MNETVDLAALNDEEQRELYELLKEKELRSKRNRLAEYRPYAKQREFHEKGAQTRERLLLGANQSGKTVAGAYEVAMHLTGRYPDWWRGRRFPHAVRVLCGSETGELTRKGAQRLLLGPPEIREEWGTGAIPHGCLVGTSMKQGVADAVASAVVKHESGDHSVIQFNSYDQGRTRWQAETVHCVWMDEEPPLDVYTEAVTRTNATGGLVFITFTPLLGMSEVVRRYVVVKADGTATTTMTIEDAEHYTPAQRAAIIAAYPEHEREARAMGVPMLGSGRVFPVAESALKVAPFPLPPHWPRIVGIDFGIDHPTAAAWLAWDRDTDTIYVYDVYRVKGESIPVHAAALRAKGAWIPVAWPHDGLQRDKGSGEQLAVQYKQAGLAMLRERATFPDGSSGLEAGIAEMLTRMQTGRFKVFSHLNDWFEEYRLLHRREGMIVKEGDDILAATRYATVMRRFAKTHAESDSSFFSAPVLDFGVLDPVTGY